MIHLTESSTFTLCINSVSHFYMKHMNKRFKKKYIYSPNILFLRVLEATLSSNTFYAAKNGKTKVLID